MHEDDTISNPSRNPHLFELFPEGESRRRFMQKVAAAGVVLGTPLVVRSPWGSEAMAMPPTTGDVGSIGFTSVPLTGADKVTVPNGYTARVIHAWGDPISSGTAIRPDVSDTAADQEKQVGMHHDGLHFFPFVETGAFGIGRLSSTHGLLVVNHEYTDDGLLFIDGRATWTAEKVKKAQAAHGVSVVEVRLESGQWKVVRPSVYARRFTAYTPMSVSGPAAGNALLKTAADPKGDVVLGTANNCAMGFTPWGTYLTCEENFNGYFVNASGSIPRRPGALRHSAAGFGYRWHEFDTRFDAAAHPNEVNRFGYVVEIDPWDPQAAAVKRTALGRFKHEGAAVTLAPDGRVVAYMGDDERFEYVYKFVSANAYRPGDRASNMKLLDEGTLYVARFDANGTGAWLPLVAGQGPLTAANGFPDQGTVCVRTRQAADAVGATKMDRPEWIAVHPFNHDVYVTLTNNSQRGDPGRAAPDAANPRAKNTFGHILRFAEASSNPSATTFTWNIFAQAGDPLIGDPNKAGDIVGDTFGSPDGAWFDQRGVLWVQTDISTSTLGTGDYKNIPTNMMLAANPKTGEFRRFLTGPLGCEVTGVVTTPDHRTMFVSIQHPGESPSELSDPANPTRISSWPDGANFTRPRAGTIVITKDDGGFIGT